MSARFLSRWLVVFALGGVAHSALAANAYRCTDAEGAVYFSDKQCGSGQQQESIKIRAAPGPSDADLQVLKDRQDRQQRLLDSARQDRADKARQKVFDDAKKKRAKKERCDQLNTRLSKLDSRVCTREAGCTIYALTKQNEDGEVVFLSEREKRAEIQRLKSEIARECS